MPKQKILVVEDEEDILELLLYNLREAGYEAKGLLSGCEVLFLLKEESFDLIILDIMLRGQNGLEICRLLKKGNHAFSMPIILLTAKSEEEDIVLGLESGADDYITKPFSPKVLIARIKAVLRRWENKDESKSLIKIHDISINLIRHEVVFEGKQLDLTYSEFRILQFLAAHAGWVFTRNQILDAIQGIQSVTTERAIDVQMVGLRKKLGNASKYIETIRGVGYRFKD